MSDEIKINKETGMAVGLLVSDIGKRLNSAEKMIDKLQAENELLRECVEFYADTNTWHNMGKSIYKSKITISTSDAEFFRSNGSITGKTVMGGKLARQTLDKLDKNSEAE